MSCSLSGPYRAGNTVGPKASNYPGAMQQSLCRLGDGVLPAGLKLSFYLAVFVEHEDREQVAAPSKSDRV